MIIIAGAGHPRSEKYVSIRTTHCNRCHNDSLWIFEKTKYHVSLFFVPVLPYKTEFVKYCGICGNSKTLTKEDFESSIRMEARPYK